MSNTLTPRQTDIECIFNLHKSAYGVKPNLVNLNAMSGPELGTYLEDLGLAADIQREVEEDRALVAFGNLQNYLDTLMHDNQIDFETAIRWEMQATDVTDIDEWLDCWNIDVDDTHHFGGNNGNR
jgi:hypothetical protein